MTKQTKLGEISDIFVGLQTSADNIFILDYVEHQNDLVVVKNKKGDKFKLEKELVHPLISGVDLNRYTFLKMRQCIIFPYIVVNEKAELIDINTISSKYPKIYEYLQTNKKTLEQRENGKFIDNNWHRFGRNQNLGIQNRSKICIPRLVNELSATIDEYGFFFLDNVDVGGLVLKDKYKENSNKYLLGIINSSLLRSIFPLISAPFHGGYMSANKQFISQLPIRTIDFANKSDVEKHDKMVALVETMLDLNKRLRECGVPSDTEMIKRQIEHTDRQIDQLVYELYGLTDDEIRIVEESFKKDK
jgi:hypothetical protein